MNYARQTIQSLNGFTVETFTMPNGSVERFAFAEKAGGWIPYYDTMEEAANDPKMFAILQQSIPTAIRGITTPTFHSINEVDAYVNQLEVGDQIKISDPITAIRLGGRYAASSPQARAIGAGIAVVVCFAITAFIVGMVIYYLLNIDAKKRETTVQQLPETNQTLYVAPDGSAIVINNDDRSIKTSSGPTIGTDIAAILIPIAAVAGAGVLGYIVYKEYTKRQQYQHPTEYTLTSPSPTP